MSQHTNCGDFFDPHGAHSAVCACRWRVPASQWERCAGCSAGWVAEGDGSGWRLWAPATGRVPLLHFQAAQCSAFPPHTAGLQAGEFCLTAPFPSWGTQFKGQQQGAT